MSSYLGVAILAMMAHRDALPGVFDREDPDVALLAFYLRSAHRTLFGNVAAEGENAVLLGTDIHVGHLLDAVADLGSSLAQLAGGHIKNAATLLACAVQDWDNCLPTAELSAPVARVAATVLDMPAGPQLTGELLRAHPLSGALLINAMLTSNHARFPTVIASLVSNHVTIASAAQMITIPNIDRRLEIFERLITKHPDLADPIIRTVVDNHTAAGNKITDLLPLDFDEAPRFYSRVHELLRDKASNRAPANYRERVVLPEPINDRPPMRPRPRRSNLSPGR
ncbi:hypothetical protein [Nocardia fluminea]|uniref:hypothetical protein n=1 Tax=Nocardia fluminea TaxID=134984 RepID=UPI003D0FFF34